MNPEIKKIIQDELKSQGLDLAEDVAVKAAKVIFRIAPKIAEATETKADDLFIHILPFIEPKVFELLDKIDGQVS